MVLNDDIVSRIDMSRNMLQKAYEKLNPEQYSQLYQLIWSIRAEMEYIVVSLKLLNNLNDREIGDKWKIDFSSSIKQVRSEEKIRNAFIETIELYLKLDKAVNILDFYKLCWMIKEKLTVLLNVVKPKHKIEKDLKINPKEVKNEERT